MIKIFLIYADQEVLGVTDYYVVGAVYTSDEAIRFIQQSKDVYKKNIENWYFEETVLGNNADKLVKALNETS